MDRLPHHNFFALPTHAHGGLSETDKLLDQLEAALRAVAALPLDASPVVAVARRALDDIERIHSELPLGQISEHVARLLHVPHDHLLSRARDQRIAFARSVAMYVARDVTHQSYPAIGRHFDRDFSTVIYACNRIARRVATDAQFRANIQHIERGLKHPNVQLAVAA